jgi:membrane-bound lytic murein transglycosylase MltF
VKTRVTRFPLAAFMLRAFLYGLLSFEAFIGAAAHADSKVDAPQVSGAPWKGDFDGMLQRHRIRALVAYSKTQYYVVKGAQHGTSYEFLKAFEDAINAKYPPKVRGVKFHVVFLPVPRDQLLARLVAGRGDIAVGALTITPEREEIVDFSDPDATGVKEIVVAGSQSAPLLGLDDLSGQEVFVRRSSSYWEHLEALNAKFKSNGKPTMRLVAAPEELENEDILEMLNSGLVQFGVTEQYLAELWQELLPHLEPRPDIVVSDGGAVAWAMRKNSPQLKAVVNEFIKTHKRGTTFGNTVLQRYTASTKMLKDATSSDEFAKFQRTVGFFQKYAGQYNVDYLLMMAQGYQESTLDQQAKSNVGAIGIMQLMPDTGKQMAVGDITQAEANVHAGVKYIRFMVDHYFADEPMSATDKLLFAFAAYNAGPGRIHTLRKEAAREGLDPNVWFGNVETVAAAKVGMETVNYVANIYKYYIAYKLVAERQVQRTQALEEVKSASN